MSSSTVTYTSVYTDFEPGRVYWGADEELSDGGSPRVILYGYDGLPMQPVAHHLWTMCLDLSTHRLLITCPVLSTHLHLSRHHTLCGKYPDEDPEGDPEEDHADYPADGGDGDDEPSDDYDDDDDDDDTDDKDEKPFEEEDDDKEEEEHIALVDSSAIPVVNPVPSAGDTEAFETDESAPTPRSPQTMIPFSQTRLRKARKTVRPEPPMSASMEARIAKHAAATTPPLHVLSPPLPLPSPLTSSPTDAGSPLGYRAARIMMGALLSPTSPRTDVPEAEMPPRNRACFTNLAPGLEIGESSAAGAARQPGPTLEANTLDEIVEAMMEVYLQLYYHYISFRGKKSSSWPSVSTSKATYIQCKISLLYFSLSTSGLTISAPTHLRNFYVSKKIPSQCRYQSATAGSACLSTAPLSAKPAPPESTQQSSCLSRLQSADLAQPEHQPALICSQRGPSVTPSPVLVPQTSCYLPVTHMVNPLHQLPMPVL
nr:hypothetical protein [Tanacetum cinerariifolium]